VLQRVGFDVEAVAFVHHPWFADLVDADREAGPQDPKLTKRAKPLFEPNRTDHVDRLLPVVEGERAE